MRKIYDSSNVLIGYSLYDGYVTTNYNTSWAVTSIQLNLSAQWTSTTATSYTYSDAYGDTYTYTVDGLGVVTGYTAQYANSAYVYSYDAVGALVSYSYSDGVTTTVYNPDGSVQSTSSSTDAFAGMTPVLDASDNVIGYSSTDDWGTVTTYFVDTESNITRYTTAYTYFDSWSGNTYTYTYSYDPSGTFTGYAYSDGTTTWSYDQNWNYLGAVADVSQLTPDGQGGYYSIDTGGTTTFYSGAGVVTGYGYEYTWDGNTYVYRYDDSWNFISSETYDGLDNLLNSSEYLYDLNGQFDGYVYFDGTTTWTYDANWNLVSSIVTDTSDMVPIYGTDGTTVIGHSSTDAWGTTTYYDINNAVTGYGTEYVWDGYTYTYRYDANWNFVSSQTYDSQDNLLYSSEYLYSNGQFAGYVYFDGTTTWTYDSNWNLLSSVANTSGMDPIYDTDGTTLIGYSSTDAWGTTTYYNSAGNDITGYGYEYVWDGYTYTYRYDDNWNFLSSETRDAGGNLLYSSEYLYSNGQFAGYVYFDGTTTWTYDSNWNLTDTSVNLNNLTADGQGGYYSVDAGGTTTYYNGDGDITGYGYEYVWDTLTYAYRYDANWNFLSSETRDASGTLLYANEYLYSNGQFAGYVYFDGTTTWTYDSNWNLISSVVSTAGMDPIYQTPGDTGSAIIGYSDSDGFGTTTYYDLTGVKTGSSYTYTNPDGSVYVSHNNAAGTYLGSETTSAQGILLYSDAYSYSESGVFLGYVSFDGTTTWTYDANWVLVSSVVSTSGMTEIYDGETLIGYSNDNGYGTTTYYDLNGIVTGSSYSSTNWDGSVSVTHYNAAGTWIGAETRDASGNLMYSTEYGYDAFGVFTGATYINVDTWNGTTTTSTTDANWNNLGSETVNNATGIVVSYTTNHYVGGVYDGYTYFDGITTWNYDASGILIGQPIVNTGGMTPILDGGGATIGYSHTDQWGTTNYYDLDGVKTGYSNSWTSTSEWDLGYTYTSRFDVYGNLVRSETQNAQHVVIDYFEYFYTYDQSGNATFNGYKHFDGTTTWTYGSNWNLISSVVSTAGMDPIYQTPGDTGSAIIGYSDSDGFGTTTYYDLAGIKTGSSFTYTNGDGAVYVGHYDASGRFLSSETHDTNGRLLISEAYSYDGSGAFLGYVYFDGTTTWTYDANWDLVSSVVSTSAMDPIFDTDGTTIIGYSDTDSFGTTTYYDLNGIVTGSSYSYTNWDGSVSVTHYNAAGTWIGSETRDASGNLMYSTEYNYDGSGNFTGATYINVDTWNGTTTTSTMDANWHNLSSVTINNSTDAVVYSTTYHYEGTDGAYSGYTYFDGVTEWVYDAFGSLISGGVADVLGDATTSVSIAVPGVLEGTIDTSHDQDWYAVSLVSGSSYVFTESAFGGMDTVLRLFDQDSQEVAYNDDYNGFNSQINFTATYTGTYYLAAGAYGLGTGAYSLNATLSGGGTPTDTTIPAVVGASFTEGANSTVTLRFSEAVTWSGFGDPMLSFFKNPDYSNGWSEEAYNASVISATYSGGLGTDTLTFTTVVSLSSTDVVQAQYFVPPMHAGLIDAGGNGVPNGEIWFGGSGASTIDLDNYGSWLPIQIRGNGGSDTLVGTNAADVLIDGGGADTLTGGEGSDTVVLVENGGLNGQPGYSRDVVYIQPGDSIVGARDLVKGSATSPTDTGFDIASGDASLHDQLSLPSALIAGNTTGIVDGTDSAGGISGHSISNGIATFYNTSGTSLAVVFNATDAVPGTSVTSTDAVAYLAANIDEVGATVGFKVDVNNDGSLTNSDSLVVFQDAGTLVTQGGIAPSDTLVTLSGLIGVADATLGTVAGPNVVQIVDTQGPEVVGFGLTSNGFQLDFTENALMPTVQANLALTMKKNGTIDVAFTGVVGDGTANWTVQTDQSFTQEDWVLINYNGTDSSNGFHDALGNVRMDHDDVGYGGSAEGGSGNTVIDLSNSSVFAAGGYDLEGAPGNDTLIGSAGSDWLEGGTGADLMTGGAGEDEFAFNAGDGTAFTYADGVYTFAGGADVITDFAPGDAVYLNLPANRDWAATSPANMGDGDYILVQGDYSGGSFHENAATGADTLLVYDGDATSNFAATGVVLSGVAPSEFDANGNYITLMQQTPGGDTTAPVLQGAVVNGATLTLTYSEALDATSIPLAGDFAVGTGAPPPLVPSSVAVSGATVTLTLPTAVAAGATVTLSYMGTNIQDSAGNDAANLLGQNVTNNTSGTTAGSTFINWTNNYTDAAVVTGDDIRIQVHFSNAVVVDATSGTPSLSLDIYNDNGTLSHTVQASFQQYNIEGFNPAFGQNSMMFVYTAGAADIGTFHIGNVSLNGGSIISMADQLQANLTLDSTNRTITAGNYLYGDMVATGTGTAANDVLGVYVLDPSKVTVAGGAFVVPTEGGSYAVTGGAGVRDTLGVPVVLPNTVTTAEAATGYYLKYDAANGLVSAIASDGSVATSVAVPSWTMTDGGVEQLIYYIVYSDGANYHDTDARDILLTNGVATYTDAAVSNEHFVRGSLNADVINLSSDADSAVRYTVRGGAGNDTITGSAGNDAILGEGGANVINAGAGDDVIFVANNGNNTVADGGTGADKLVFELAGQQMAIAGRIMGPAIQSQVGTWGQTGFVANGTTNAYRLDTSDDGAVIVMDYTTLAPLMTATSMEALQFRFDQWDGRVSMPLIFGTGGSDNLANVGTVSALLSGGAGSDTLAASNLGNDILMGGSGNDSLVGGTARDLLYGGAGDDQINAGAGNYDWIVGGTGNDVLDGGTGTDYAGFVVHASGTTTPVIGAYDSSIGGFKVSQDGVDLAQIVWNAANSTWTVTDLSDLTATGFGTDTVSNVEYLTFDQDAGGIQALNVDMASLASQLGGGTSSDTTAPTVVGANFTTNSITLTFSEALVTLDASSQPTGLMLFQNPDPANGNQGTAIQVTGFTVSGNAYTFQTSTVLGTNDVLQATYDAGWGNMGDAAGNELTSGEVWFGGNVANTIDLDNYGSWLPIQIRGNGGIDQLLGTSAADVLIDGGGADMLMGREGSDTHVLVENGGLNGQPGYSRDVVFIRPGDSVVGIANRDIVVGSASSPSDTGFDIVSSNAALHDQLSLPSALIAGSTAGLVDGTDSAGGIASHSIANGIASFYNASGTLLSVVYNVADASTGVRVTSTDAVGYLVANFHEVGATVAFKVDLNSDGSLNNLDSLVIFQDAGTLVTQGGFAPLDTLVTLSGQGGYGLMGLAAATLGTTEGANVVQLVDVQGPEVIGFGLTTGNSFQLDFTESAWMPTVPTNLALTMKKSGTIDVAFTGVVGDGTANWTVGTDQNFTQEDWVLINYTGSDSSNGFRDALGNVMVDQPDPGYGGSAEGGSGNNTIDLSNVAIFSATGGYDLSGAAGNDIMVGSAYEDWMSGGTGADTMTGGGGPDGFELQQGDSPLVTLDNGVYSFTGGAADVITDFGADDAIWIDMSVTSSQGPRSYGDSSYEVVQGSYAAGAFTAGTGADTLLIYDGDPTAGAVMTGVVLSNVTAMNLETFGNYITLNTQPV